MNISEFLQRPIDKISFPSGWVKLESAHVDESALAEQTEMVARKLGTPTRGRSRPLVEVLRPRGVSDAPATSLSGKYGFDQFPFHVDGAHWSVPARFLILACVESDGGTTPTLLVDRMAISLTQDEEVLLRSAAYLVRNGRNSFYGSILTGDRPFARVDPGCMEPLSADGERALKLFSAERLAPHVQAITWNVGDVVVIDNWRMLHARAPVQSNKSERILLRCLVT
jgi:alpha-ketoglutarate-dependent taurine dioxygenase